MITIISAVLGFLGSMLPEIVSLFRDIQDRKHELEVMRLQMEQQRLGHANKLEAINLEADIAETRALYTTYNSNIRWVDALNATVRPVLAYAFFSLYAAVKWLQWSIAGFSIEAAALNLWSQEDQAIFAGIISFYFGQRAFRKMRSE
jgi:hypothetical protein